MFRARLGACVVLVIGGMLSCIQVLAAGVGVAPALPPTNPSNSDRSQLRSSVGEEMYGSVFMRCDLETYDSQNNHWDFAYSIWGQKLTH